MAYTKPNILASGAAFADLQAGGASGHLELLIAAQAATLAPTVAAAWVNNGQTSGGALAAGTYYQVITETNGIGETTHGPVSTQITLTATYQPTITFQTLKTGNTARNVYLGLPSGANTGPFYLYATGITTATYTLAAAAPGGSYGATQPPSVNTTGLAFANSSGVEESTAVSLLRAAKQGNLEDVFKFYARAIANFTSGQPVSYMGIIEKLRHAHTVFAMLATMAAEAGTLVDANPGHFAATVSPIGVPAPTRAWP